MSMQWTWVRPKSLDETVGLLLSHGQEAFVIAGGTALALNPPKRDGAVLIDLQALGLDTITDVDGEGSGKIRLGAMVTAQQLVKSEVLDRVGTGMLHEVGSTMGPRPVRNRVTIGGNVMQTFRWCDIPVALRALDARFEIFGAGGLRTLGAEELFKAQPRRALKQDEVLSAVVLSKDQPGQGGAFHKLTLTSVDHALVSAAAHVTIDGGVCRAARLVVGALKPIPQRLHDVEKRLVGKKLDSATLDSIGESVKKAVDVSGDKRADEGYRREVSAVVLRRTLETAIKRAEGGAR
jgi:CO/xanthine dehydrogenase FAD-binding subunit